ncbi:MAG: hypothetical protein IAX22_00490 [Candidatus Bathyarchaeota archaeon]|nr:hypothetical protein [Candidatus Bathyarchaeota archaeon]
MVAFGEQQQIVSQAKTLDSIENQASYINRRVEVLTTFGSICRAHSDYWKFLICGSGMCGEMATANINLMNAAGLITCEVTIPGEHAFVEVNVDGEWLIPSGSSMINRTVFANNRLRNPGSLSYVIARTGDSFIELTQYYVSTDLVTIRVTQNYMPVSGVKLSLHRSGVLSATIPDADLFFYTDVNGTATFHLGKPNFIGQYEKTDLFYKVLIDGKETNYNITSTGTGKCVLLEISL